MKYLYIKQAIVIAVFVVLTSCSRPPIIGPVDEFPNYLSIKFIGEPIAGNTRVYLVSPSDTRTQESDTTFFAGITTADGSLMINREDYSGIFNMTAVNGTEGVFVDSIDFSTEGDTIEINLETLGEFVVIKDVIDRVFYTIYGTPWFGVIDSGLQGDTIRIPQGEYSIAFATDVMFSNIISSTTLNNGSGTIPIIDLTQDSGSVIDTSGNNNANDTSMTIALYTPQSGILPSVSQEASTLTNSGVRIINGLFRENGVIAMAHNELLQSIIVEQVQTGGVEFYITDFLFLDAPERYNISNMNDSTDMARLYSGIRYVFEAIGNREAKVVIEPVLIGKLALQIVAGSEQSVLVPSSNENLVAGDIRGFFAAIIEMRNQYAPNACVGFYVSDDLRINETSPGILGLVDRYIDSLAIFWHEFLIDAGVLNEIQFLTLGLHDTSLTHFSLFNSMGEWQIERYLIMGERLGSVSGKDVYLLELPTKKSIIEQRAYIVPLGTAGYDRSLSRFFFANQALFYERGFDGIIYSGEPAEAIDLVFEIE